MGGAYRFGIAGYRPAYQVDVSPVQTFKLRYKNEPNDERLQEFCSGLYRGLPSGGLAGTNAQRVRSAKIPPWPLCKLVERDDLDVRR